jgi:hypothetical protein
VLGRGEIFYDWLTVAGYLVPLAMASASMGLLISAAVGRNRQLAAAVLPLVMMVQIVFSAEICGDGGSLDNAYGTETSAQPALWMTYGTLSRYGDIALRSFAYRHDDYQAYLDRDSLSAPLQERGGRYASQRRTATLVLLAAAVGLSAAAGGILVLQGTIRLRRGQEAICQRAAAKRP